MGAIAPLWAVAIGSVLVFLVGVGAVVALCLRALREGADFEGEIKAPSFSLKIRSGSARESGLARRNNAHEDKGPTQEGRPELRTAEPPS